MQKQTTIEKQTFVVIQAFLKDLQPHQRLPDLSPHASLERDLSVGSIEKAELFHRLEQAFTIKLPEHTLGDVDTLAELISAIETASPIEAQKHIIKTMELAESHVNPSKASTLVEVLRLYTEKEPERPHIYLQDAYGKEEIISYHDLKKAASNVAKGIQAYGVKPSENIAIMLPTSKDFFASFMGVLLAGCVPVPIYPPFRATQLEAYAKRETLILNNAEVRLLITFDKAEHLSLLLKKRIPSLLDVCTVSYLNKKQKPLPAISIKGADSALIQYTSGSTGQPKGVLLSHKNLITNIRTFGKGMGIKSTDVVVSWLPLYHDMGLIGAWLGSLYHGIPLILTSPLTFLARPESWLWNIHYHRGTISVGPNFAYELCLKKIQPKDIEGLDLSSWRLALNGAEAIYPDTLRRFSKRFARYGFKKEALMPVYGLAESTVGLTSPILNRAFHVDKIDYDAFASAQKAIPAPKNAKQWREFVSCGKALEAHEIRVVDNDSLPLPERMVGNVQFKGPSSMQGYYANPKATRAIYHDGWWDTGDLGYFVDGELFITGRKKDLIIKAGRNYSPEEIEEEVNQLSHIRKGCVVAFGLKDKQAGTEKVIIIAETIPDAKVSQSHIIQDIKSHITTRIGIPPDEVLLVAPHTVLKTSSGKLKRTALKEQYHKGLIHKQNLPIWLQALRVFVSNWSYALKTCVKNIGKLLYGFYYALQCPYGCLLCCFHKNLLEKL